MSTVDVLYGRPWDEKEYLIVLDSYFRNREKTRHKKADYVLEISELLGRTPSSIVMRMENYASIDSKDHRKGMDKFSPECVRVFSEWHDKIDHLESCVAVLRKEYAIPDQLDLFRSNKPVLPKAFERYELLELIGEGGSGYVFSCIDTETDELLALKILKTGHLRDPEILHRFKREIRMLQSVRQKNIIKLYNDNLDEEERFPSFVMEFAPRQLTTYINQKAHESPNSERPILSSEDSLEIFRSIIAAIKHLHEQRPRIIHRDINPNNILQLEDNTWLLADFGIAKFISTAPSTSTFATKSDVRGFGTAYYTAPEQYRNFKATDERTDIYSLGILIWELYSEAWPPPDKHDPNLPKSLEVVFKKATQNDPEARYQSIQEFQDAFEEAT